MAPSEGAAAPSLPGFETTRFTHDGKTRTVYRAGRGPGVVIMHEIPGIYPAVIDFARRVAGAGFSVYLPDMFGTPGRPLSTTKERRVINGAPGLSTNSTTR